MSKQHHETSDIDLEIPFERSDSGSPGKRSMTQSLSPRPIIFRVESAEAARELGAAFGPRDRNGVAEGAETAVDRAAGNSGEPLREDLRARFESSLGTDLSAVRIHTGGASAEASSAVGAKAYTVGNDVHFGAGQYQPDDPFGMHLIAHEVAHTQQQAGGAAHRQNKLEVSTPNDPAEAEADRAADAMVSGAPAMVSGGGGLARATLFRAPDDNTDGNGPGTPPVEPTPLPSCGDPPELHWDQAPPYFNPITTPWSTAPVFGPHDETCDPKNDIWNDRKAFQGSWGELQGIWNAAQPLYVEYDKKAASAEAAANETKVGGATGGTTDPLESMKLNVSGLKMNQVFDAGGMKTDPALMLSGDELSPDVRSDMTKTRAALKETISGEKGTVAMSNAVAKAGSGVTKSLLALDTAVNGVNIKKNDLEEKEMQQAIDDLAIEKAEWTGVVSAMTSVSKSIASADPGDAVEGLGKLVETSAAKQFDIDIRQLTSKVNSLKVKSANLEVQNAMNGAASAVIDVNTALGDLVAANTQYETSLAARRTAYREMSIEVSKLASDVGGASPEEAAQLQAALQAMPMMAEVLAALRPVIGALSIPAYSEASGRGAAQSESGPVFKMFVSTVKGNIIELDERRINWELRLEQLEDFIDSL